MPKLDLRGSTVLYPSLEQNEGWDKDTESRIRRASHSHSKKTIKTSALRNSGISPSLDLLIVFLITRMKEKIQNYNN